MAKRVELTDFANLIYVIQGNTEIFAHLGMIRYDYGRNLKCLNDRYC